MNLNLTPLLQSLFNTSMSSNIFPIPIQIDLISNLKWNLPPWPLVLVPTLSYWAVTRVISVFIQPFSNQFMWLISWSLLLALMDLFNRHFIFSSLLSALLPFQDLRIRFSLRDCLASNNQGTSFTYVSFPIGVHAKNASKSGFLAISDQLNKCLFNFHRS